MKQVEWDLITAPLLFAEIHRPLLAAFWAMMGRQISRKAWNKARLSGQCPWL
jgi:hypothetical protein